MKKGIPLAIVGVFAILLSIFTPDVLQFLNGFMWKVSVFVIGVFMFICGIFNIFHKEK